MLYPPISQEISCLLGRTRLHAQPFLRNHMIVASYVYGRSTVTDKGCPVGAASGGTAARTATQLALGSIDRDEVQRRDKLDVSPTA